MNRTNRIGQLTEGGSNTYFMESFYATVATFCFTLIGLWWGVAQTRLSNWIDKPNLRRLSQSVIMAFLIPGIMSLGSQLAGEIKLLWRMVFASAGILGIVAAAQFLVLGHTTRMKLYLLATVVLYLLVIVFAIAPTLLQGILFVGQLQPLQIEGLLLCVLILCGVGMAWELMWDTHA